MNNLNTVRERIQMIQPVSNKNKKYQNALYT